MSVAPAAAGQTTSEAGQTTAVTEENPIAGKSMILVKAFGAGTKTMYTFDASNPEDRFLLVPSKLRSGHMLQASEQKVKTAGWEFTERFYGGNSQYDENLIGDGGYMVSNEMGNTLWFHEWKGAPIIDESKLNAPEKGTTVANTQIFVIGTEYVIRQNILFTIARSRGLRGGAAMRVRWTPMRFAVTKDPCHRACT